MGTRRYCDICNDDLPTSDSDIYLLKIFPNIAVRTISSYAKSQSISKEICPNCAEKIKNYIESISTKEA